MLSELMKLYPHIDKKALKNASDTELHDMSTKLNEPRFLSFAIKRNMEKMEVREQRRKFFMKK